MKDEFKYTLTPNEGDNQEDEYEKMLEKDIESQCNFGVYVNKLELNDNIPDNELLNKTKEEIIEYKNSQILKLKAYVASLEKEKEDLIDNFKETTNQLLERLKDEEFKTSGFRPETPMITKNINKKGGVKQSDFKSLNKNNNQVKLPNKIQRCPNCQKEFPEEVFIAHSLECLRKTFHCKKCGELVNENDKKEHLDKFRLPDKIIEYINNGNADYFNKVVVHGFQINSILDKDENETALHLMCKFNRVQMIKNILNNKNIKIDLNIPNKNKDTPLFVAIINKNEQCARLLINKGADIKIKNKSDYSALMLACKYGLINIVRELVSKGANINEKNILGETPLKIAQKNNNEELELMMLKEFNAEINKK